MRRGRSWLAVLMILACGPLVAESDGARPGTLEVKVKGLRSAKGSIALALFDDRDSFAQRSEPVRAEFVRLRRKRCRWIVEDLPPGTYALVAYHDKNDNRELDRRKMFGIPSEPYGFSNDARGQFGPPQFEEARFEVEGGANAITIRVR